MKFDLRLQATQFVAASRAKIWTQLSSFQGLLQGLLQGLRRLSWITRRWFLHQAVTFVSLALMAALLIGGLQAVGERSPKSAVRPASAASAMSAASLPQGWSRLPRPARSAAPQGAQPAAKRKLKARANPIKPAKPVQPSQPPAPIPAGSSALSTAPSTAPSAAPSAAQSAAITALQALDAFMPRQEAAPADASNYGNRYSQDVFGKPVANQPLIVLHETVGSADSAINTFQVAHQDEAMQVSYHSLIRRDGTIVYLVPPEKRAFGAGHSVFQGSQGAEAVKTDSQFPPSVNNFAYHISLETPPGGANEYETHSGYSEAQYRSLAWLVAHTGIPDERITTHRAIDQSGSRIDPRSFDQERFLAVLHSLPRPYLSQSY